MGDILPHKRQTVVDRLRRRIEHYRRHQSHCQPRYNSSLNGLLEHHHQDTLLLRQRFLEAKAKKSGSNNNKKNNNSDHHHHNNKTVNNNNKESATNAINNNSSSLGAQSKYKRVATDISTPSPLESLTKVSVDDCNDQHGKLPTCPSSVASNANNGGNAQQNMDQGLTQFSVEIVQQFTTPGQTQGQQIQTNVTVTAVAGNIKTSDSPVPNSNVHTSTATSNCKSSTIDKTIDGVATLLSGSEKQTPVLSTIECKQEPKYDLEHCGGGGTGLDGSGHNNNNEQSFSDSFSSFIDDSNDDDINLNFNTDTLNYLMDALPQDLMTAYLERLEDDDDDVKTHDEHHHHHHHHHNHQNHEKEIGGGGGGHLLHHHHSNHLSEMNKPGGDQQDPLSSAMNSRTQVPFCTNSSVQSCPLLFSSVTTSCNASTTSMNPLSSLNPLNQGRIGPPYGTSLGFELTLKEQSPAAQTLKQMAEQHQNMQQKQQQHLGMGLGSSSSPYGTDFGLGSTTSSYGSSNMDFLSSSTGAPFMQTTKGSPNSMFPFGSNPLTSMNTSMMKQDPMFRPGLRQSASNMGHHLLPHHMDIRKQQIQTPVHQRLGGGGGGGGADQKPVLGHSPGPSPGPGQPNSNVSSTGASPSPCSTGGMPSSSPLSFGATKPLTHFSDPQQQTPVNNNSNNASSSPVTGLQQFLHGGGGPGQSGGGGPPSSTNPSQSGPPQPSSQQAQQSPSYMNMNAASSARLQASQSQQMQVNRNAQQQNLQVSQGQHIQMNDLKGQQQQQQQMMYNFSQQQQATANGDHYQLNVNQSQSVSFGGGGGQMPNRVSGGVGSGTTASGGGPSPLSSMMPQSGGGGGGGGVGRSPAMMHQEHMIRQQMMDKQKMSQMQHHQQQQQQRLSQFTSNRPPPPEYNAQVSPMGHQMVQQQGMLGMMAQNQVFSANGQLRTNMAGQIGTNPSNGGNTMMSNPSTMGLGSRGTSSPGGGSPSPMLNSGGANHMNLNGGGRVSNQSMTIPTRPSYSVSMLREQRPPNVNIGPDGLNIGLRGMTSQDWRQMMAQNQAKFQSLGGCGGPTNSVHGDPGVSMVSNQGHPRPIMMGPQRGYQQSQQQQQQPMHMMSMHHQTHPRMVGGGGMMRAPNSTGMGPSNSNNPPASHSLSMMQQQQMQSRGHPNQQSGGGGVGVGGPPSVVSGGQSNPIMTMQMSSSITMSTGVSGFGLTNPTNQNNTSLGSDFNFDFLDSLSGPSSMDGGAFGPNDADLLNSFDSVMQNGNSTLNLLEGL